MCSFPVAYKTNENMLICAPTGAGKTDAAMLTVLNAVGKIPNQAKRFPSFSVTSAAKAFMGAT
jgi:replicative superfamily II helicase